MSLFPAALDNLAENKANATDQSTDHSAHHNSLADECPSEGTASETTAMGPMV